MATRRSGRSQARRSGGVKTGLVLLVGLLIGLGLAALYLMFGDRGRLDAILPQPDPQAQAPTQTREHEPVAQEPASTASRPTFDFYTVLPEKEVQLPEERVQALMPTAIPTSELPAPVALKPAATAPPQATTGTDLLLQAGAFRNAGDAEALRARLALVGQIARIETVQVDGRTLHRVRLGPYADVTSREAAQKALADAGIAATPAR